MTEVPYAYQNREGIQLISWKNFFGICKGISEAVYPYRPDLILAIGRGGFYPGTLLAHMLQVEIYPVRLSRRVRDVVKYQRPRWLVRPPASVVKAQRVLIVDEVCDSGETLAMVSEKMQALDADAIRSAVLYSHSWGASIPDYIGLITDRLILNPWDREILLDGSFQFHPEYVQALAQQGMEPALDMLIEAPRYKIAKGGA